MPVLAAARDGHHRAIGLTKQMAASPTVIPPAMILVAVAVWA
jgi:hypothetical protein